MLADARSGASAARRTVERRLPRLSAQLLDERREANLPPFAHFALLRAEAKAALRLDAFLAAASAALTGAPVVAHGPMPAPMPRRAGVLRGQLLIEAEERAGCTRFFPGGSQVCAS